MSLSLQAVPASIREDVEESTHHSENELLWVILQDGCPLLETLQELTRKGWQDRNLDKHFADRRLQNSKPSYEQDERFWFNVMRRSMAEMDAALDIVPKAMRGLKFLDLGCAPGGYSMHVLQNNPSATGVGITLPLGDGGHRFMIRSPLSFRYAVHYADLTQYNLQRPEDQTFDTLSTLPFDPTTTFHLVILDGHCLHSRPFEHTMPHMLLVSQLIIALQHVSDGGTIFIKLNKPARATTARILFLLDSISSSLSTVKPQKIHSNRGTFYAVAKGIKKGRVLDSFLEKLRDLRERMVREPYLNTFAAWDDIVPLWIVKETYISRLIELGSPVWAVQIVGLQWFLTKKGVLQRNANLKPLIFST